MRRFTAVTLLFAPILLAAASAPVAPAGETADSALAQARAEAKAATKRLAALNAAAAKAGNEADRLRADRAAAAAAIDEAEARISESDAGLRLACARRLIAGQIVEPAPRMAVDHRKPRLLLFQVLEDRHQRDMLDDIGKIARVIAVTVVHDFNLSRTSPD